MTKINPILNFCVITILVYYSNMYYIFYVSIVRIVQISILNDILMNDNTPIAKF